MNGKYGIRIYIVLGLVLLSACGFGGATEPEVKSADVSHVVSESADENKQVEIKQIESLPEVVESLSGADTSLNIRLDETVMHNDLYIKWVDINDSRCPTEETCFWEGQVIVVLQLWKVGGQRSQVEFIQRVGVETNDQVVYGVSIGLTDVRPYPVQSIDQLRSDYLAVLTINES